MIPWLTVEQVWLESEITWHGNLPCRYELGWHRTEVAEVIAIGQKSRSGFLNNNYFLEYEMWRCWVIVRDGKLGWTAIVIVVTLMNITAAGEDSWPGHEGILTGKLVRLVRHEDMLVMSVCHHDVYLKSHDMNKIARSWDGDCYQRCDIEKIIIFGEFCQRSLLGMKKSIAFK